MSADQGLGGWREAARVGELTEQLPMEKEKLKAMPDTLLLQHYVHHKASCYMSAFKNIHDEMAEACEAEILSRMAKPTT